MHLFYLAIFISFASARDIRVINCVDWSEVGDRDDIRSSSGTVTRVSIDGCSRDTINPCYVNRGSDVFVSIYFTPTRNSSANGKHFHQLYAHDLPRHEARYHVPFHLDSDAVCDGPCGFVSGVNVKIEKHIVIPNNQSVWSTVLEWHVKDDYYTFRPTSDYFEDSEEAVVEDLVCVMIPLIYAN